MKYKFQNKAKSVNPEEVNSQMDFDKVVSGAKGFYGAKLSSGALKVGSSKLLITSVSIAVITVVISTVLILNPDNPEAIEPENNATELNVNQPPLESENQVSEQIDDSQTREQTEIEETENQVAENTEPEAVSGAEDNSTVEANQPSSNTDDEDIVNEDVVVRAHPLPNYNTFVDFINENLVYPEAHLNDGIEGYVRVHFEISKEGKARDFKISKSLGEAFDEEAIRVLKLYQSWEPTSYNGQAVDSNVTFKVTFKTN